MALAERFRARIPSLKRFYDRARENPRAAAYDLLPVFDGRARDGIVATNAALRPRTTNFLPSSRARSFHGELSQDGLTAVQPALPDHILGDLRDWFDAIPCHDPYRPHLGEFRHDAPPSPEVNIGYYHPDQVAQAPHVWDLANDPDILACMELYFGCKPTVDNVGASWSYPGRAEAKGGQRFHRDYDSARNVKVFYYLTEVDEEAGPHVFVRGSHRSALLETIRAQSDVDIITTFGARNLTRITGAAGSWFIEDVYGFHKGLLPVAKPRLMLGVEYTVYPSPHAPRAPFLEADTRFDTYINRLFFKG